MIKQSDKVLADALVKKGLFLQEQMNQHLSEVEAGGETLKAYLVRKNLATEQNILEGLAAALHLEIINLKQISVEPGTIEKIPVKFAWYYKFMPLKLDGKVLTLATSTPFNVKFQDEIRVHLGLEPKILLAKESEIIDALNKYYGLAADTVDRLAKVEDKKGAKTEEAEAWVEDLEKEDEDASISKLVNQILLEACKKRATDIHIEPYRSKVRVRYRIDGVLVDANIPASVRQFMASIISRIKLMSNLSIVERRLPQDGSAVVKTKEQDLDLRVSTIPTPRGESMVIRILPSKVTLLSLEKLGLDRENLQMLRGVIKKPHGIVLVTGPTGSGKTTTLYACLNEINSPARKIITLEDPLEYEMEGITQIQVNAKVKLDFATGLRSVLRHDPDIIMVGEIRDLETAEIAIRTALTGHLVFSTLHTNDAASGITRLVEMGLEPFLVASSIEAFIAQRLIRLICPHCREEVKTPLLEIREEISESLKINDVGKVKIFQGKGCDACNQTGFYGRTAIYETLIISDDIREAILNKERAGEIKKLAMKNGMISLRQDGWRKVMEGLTTPTEVLNVTVKDEFLQGTMPVKEEKETPPAAPKTPDVQKPGRSIKPELLKQKNDYDSRIYERVKIRVNISYSVVKQDEQDPTRLLSSGIERSSVTRDISAGGVRFIAGYSIPVGTILDVKIHLFKEERSIDCLAKVCRVEEDTLSAMFSVVAYFLDITSADRVRVEHYLKSVVQQNQKQNESGQKT